MVTLVQKSVRNYNSFLSFIIALILSRNSANARNCYCLASYPSLLLALVNGSTDTTFPNEADEEPFAESVDG